LSVSAPRGFKDRLSFTKRFDVYAGIAYSEVTGGLEIAIPHGPGVPYYYNNNVAPTVGVRYTF
jgi:hypothetical protein